MRSTRVHRDSAASFAGFFISLLSGNSPYTLNYDAFAYHTANFRATVIESTLSRVGLTNLCARLKAFPPFDGYLGRQFPDRSLESLTAGEMYFYIDDLAQRRNEVSHGTPSELLSTDLLGAYVDFIEAFGTALYEFVRAGALEHEVRHRCKQVGQPIAVYNHSIVCVKLKETGVKVSDLLIAHTGNTIRPYIAGPIAEVQVDGTPYQSLAPQPEVDVGLRVNFRAKDNYTYYLLDAESA